MHYQRWRVHGDVNKVETKRPNRKWSSDVGYGTAHWRVRRSKGPANWYPCIDCGGEATEWSYNFMADSDERREGALFYSVNPVHYEPRCNSCHKRFDTADVRSLYVGNAQEREWS